MSQAELYRSYAGACVRAAQHATNDAERARWIGMAQHWVQWAEQEEAGRDLSRPMPTPSQPAQQQVQQQQQPQPDDEKKD